MTKVTYLLGAGASFHSVPTVKDMSGSFAAIGKELNAAMLKALAQPGMPWPKEKRAYPEGPVAADFLRSVEWLRAESERHASVDTFAKKLFLRNDHESRAKLARLKATLSCYLLLVQSLRNVDYRYDSFFASVLTPAAEGEPALPDWMNVVSWNYDLQLEKSFHEFSSTQGHLERTITKNARIVRLNGMCGHFADNTGFLATAFEPFGELTINAIVTLYQEFSKPQAVVKPSIHFAWEKPDNVRSGVSLMKGTEILVVIGYSFPFFNREVDRELLGATKGTVRKVFVQVAEPDRAAVRQRISPLLSFVPALDRDVLLMLDSTDQFHIPDEVVLA
jgi:hypothetical protein